MSSTELLGEIDTKPFDFPFWQDEMSIQLIVQEVPEQPKNLRINSQQSRSLQLTWSQPFAGNSPIEEYHIYYKQISGRNKKNKSVGKLSKNLNLFKCKICNLNSTYKYRVYASKKY